MLGSNDLGLGSVDEAASAGNGNGGNGVQRITSTGNTIAITNPNGPTTDIEVIQQPPPTGLAAFNNTVIRSVRATGTPVQLIGSGDSLMQGVTTGHPNDGRHSLMYRVFSNVALQTASKAPGGYVTRWCQAAGLATPVYNNTAVPGTDTTYGLANVTATLITPVADGNVVITNWGINDQIHGTPLATTISNVVGICNAFFAARPNSKLIWLPALFNGSQAWALDSFGRPQGNGSNDAGIRAINQAIAGVLALYPNALYFGQLYYDMWASIAKDNSPAGSVAVLNYTQDGIHPNARAVAVAGRSIFRLLSSAGALFPSFLQQASQADFREGDWYEVQKEIVEGGWTNFSSTTIDNCFNYNRDRRFDMSQPYWLALSNIAGASIEGGGIVASPPNVTLLSQTLYQTPATAPIAVTFDVQFPAIAAGRKGYVGLFDSLFTAAGAGSCLAFGIDQTVNGTNFILKYRNAGSADFGHLLGTADANRHTVMILWDGNASGISTGVLQVLLDGKEVLFVNPTIADFPVVPLALGVGQVASGGSPTVAKAILLYNEPEAF